MGVSKKLENLQAAVALHFGHYNLMRLHKSLRVKPAMAANVTDRLEESEKRRFFAVLHLPPITSPVDAVRAAIVREHRTAEANR